MLFMITLSPTQDAIWDQALPLVPRSLVSFNPEVLQSLSFLMLAFLKITSRLFRKMFTNLGLFDVF